MRQSLGLTPDDLDERTTAAHADLTRTLEAFGQRNTHDTKPPRSAPISIFFARADLHDALIQGLVQTDTADLDADSYYKQVEKTLRDHSNSGGFSHIELVPTRVQDLLDYAAQHDLDPRDQANPTRPHQPVPSQRHSHDPVATTAQRALLNRRRTCTAINSSLPAATCRRRAFTAPRSDTTHMKPPRPQQHQAAMPHSTTPPSGPHP